MHLAATLGGKVEVAKSQQEQSLLYVVVCAGSVVVIVLVQATNPCRFQALLSPNHHWPETLQSVRTIQYNWMAYDLSQLSYLAISVRV